MSSHRISQPVGCHAFNIIHVYTMFVFFQRIGFPNHLCFPVPFSKVVCHCVTNASTEWLWLRMFVPWVQNSQLQQVQLLRFFIFGNEGGNQQILSQSKYKMGIGHATHGKRSGVRWTSHLLMMQAMMAEGDGQENKLRQALLRPLPRGNGSRPQQHHPYFGRAR